MILGRFRMRGADPDLASRRELMVVRDLRGRGIRDPRVLAAMRAVPREVFVPPELKSDAYSDRALPIGHGQTISQPYIVALMAEALALGGTETVLEIGTGSGYAAAVLAQLANWVVGIDRVPAFVEEASERLRGLGIENVELHAGDGRRGWVAEAPYDGVIVSAASPDVPAELLDQLAEGGRLVIPVGGETETQILTSITRRGRDTQIRSLCPCKFVPLVGEERGVGGQETGGGAVADT
jgi:protein-L-isoaspartate(D-aspartate) O-methyltransferase